MKPKKGETNNEMDEPMRNPLQLVKDLVLLIVEARTPDFTVKGRTEGPHCPIIRGRPAHKCSSDKVECGRAHEFSCLAQKLWLNSIPICLDILLFPDCIHGREEASVTEGAVTQVTQENVLLLERWTVDWTKRRQDDCLSSSMLTQAVRSYLHFSQISSWLFSTCGRLPGRLAYRLYAPGEVTSLDFPHPPDIHSFPVCLVNLHPIRVKVSSLQRQASVPILICRQAQSLGDNSRDTLYRDNSQGKRSAVVDAKTKQEHLKTGNSFMGGPWSSDEPQATDPVTMGYSTPAMTVKGGMKSIKPLHPLDTSLQTAYEDQVDVRYGPSGAARNPFTFTKAGNVFNHFEESDNRHHISDARMPVGRTTTLARRIVSDGGDDVETTDEVISRMCGVEDVSYGSDVAASVNTFGSETSDLLIKKLKSSHLKMERGLLNQGLIHGSNFRKGYTFLSDNNREGDIRGQQRAHMRVENEVGEGNVHSKQMRGFLRNAHEINVNKYLENNDDHRNPQTDDDDPLMFASSDMVDCYLPHHLQVEQPQTQADMEIESGQQAYGRTLSQNVWESKGTAYSHGKRRPFSCSPKQFFLDGQSLEQKDQSSSCSEAGIQGKLQTTWLDNSGHRAASGDELMNTLSATMAPSKGLPASSNLNAQLQVSESITGYTVLESPLQSEIRESVGVCDGSEKLLTKPVRKHLDRNVEFPQLTVDVSKLPDAFEDSDATPVASPNQTSQTRPVAETFMKLVAAKSMKQNRYWLQKDLTNPDNDESSLEAEDSCDSNSDPECSSNGFVKEDPHSEICSAYSQTPDQSSCRRIFEENRLPLVSYDADSDSFQKVDDFVSCNVLHSPKVLFSCDLPNTKPSSSKKCIDFSDTFEAEFFRSKMNDLVDPEAIGKYMSKLALLSGASTNGKDDQGYTDDIIVDTDQQFDDFITAGAASNGHMSSNTECLPKQKREVQDIQTRIQGTDLQSEFNNSLIMLDNSGGQSDQIQHNYPSLTVQELSHDSLECLVNKDCFPQTRRQLSYYVPENTEQVLSMRSDKHQGGIETPATVALSPVCDDTHHHHHHHVQTEAQHQAEELPEITGLRGSLNLHSSGTVASQTSPPLSSSCSSSSSSSSSSVSSVQRRSAPSSTLSPTVLAATSTHKTLHSAKDMANDSSELGVQELVFRPFSPLTSDTPLNEHACENPPRTTTRTLNTWKLPSETTSKVKSYNAEPTCSHYCASASRLLVSGTSTPSLLNSTSSTSVHSTPSSIYLTPQTPHDAVQCHTKNSRTPSLFNDPIPQISPQGNVDFESGSSIYFKCESTSNDFRPVMPDLMCNQNMSVQDLQSQRISNLNLVYCVPNLVQEQPCAKRLCDIQMASKNSIDKQNYVPYSNSHEIESTSCQSVPESCTLLDSVVSQEVDIDPSCQQDNPADNTKSAYNPLHLSRQLDKDDDDEADNISCIKVAKSRVSTNDKISEISSASLESFTECNVSAGQNIDSSRPSFSRSSLPNDSIKSLNKKLGSCISGELLNKFTFRSNNDCARIAVNLFTTEIISDESSLSQEQSFLKETNNLLQNLGVETVSQNEEKCPDVFHSSFVNQSQSSYTHCCDQETTSSEHCSQTSLETHQRVTDQHDNMHLKNPSLRVIESGLDSKNGFDLDDTATCEEKDHNWDSDVVFYLSEPDTSGKTDQPLSALSHSLKEVTCAETHKAIRPSSLSAEVNLELKLRSNPGIKHKTDLEFSTLSRSPPFLNDPPGWNSVPPHRTVSTPSGMDRESRMKEERTSANISVIQQQNCDNVSQIGLRKMAAKSASMIFNNRTGLPTQSSPAPLKRKSGGRFEYDVSLINTRAIKNAFSCSKLASAGDDNADNEEERKQTLSTSAPASTNCLLGNFEESILNGRIDPVGTVHGFSAEIGASGSFCPKHFHLPVTAFFFALSDDNAPSPYLGYINLESIGKKGYHIPKKGTVQVTLFNPNKMVVKMFVVVYDLSDMPASSQTFIRQRTVYSPVDKNHPAPSYLRYLIHLRCASSHSGKIYLHTDIRLIFARQKLDIDAKTIPYELKSYTEGPQNPKYSPKK